MNKKNEFNLSKKKVYSYYVIKYNAYIINNNIEQILKTHLMP